MFGAVAKLTLFFVTTLFAAWNHLNGDSKAGEHSLCDISISGKVDTPPAKWLGLFDGGSAHIRGLSMSPADQPTG